MTTLALLIKKSARIIKIKTRNIATSKLSYRCYKEHFIESLAINDLQPIAMSTKLLTIITFVIVQVTGQPEITTTVSKGVNSLGFKVVYGDEDLSILNQVVEKEEKKNSKKINLNEAISPLPPQDVKCLMSVDRYCSKEMGELKSK